MLTQLLKICFFLNERRKIITHIGPEIFTHFKKFCADLGEYLQNSREWIWYMVNMVKCGRLSQGRT